MRLNIGAGGTTIPGFTSVDLDPELRPDIVGDFRKMDFADVEEIYASHVLEHFFYGDAEAILRQWHDWMIPGGLLWLAVPHFIRIATLYAGGEISPHLLGLLYGANARPEWAHHSGWSEEHLRKVLKQAGFTVIGTFEPFVKNREQNGADWSGAWHRMRNGTISQVSLNLKAQRNP